MEGSPYRKFSFSWGSGQSQGPDPEDYIAGTGVPPSGDPEAGVLPGVSRNSIPEYFFSNNLDGRLMYHCRAGPVRVEPNPLHMVASRDSFGSATANILSLYWVTWSFGSVVSSYAFMRGK